MAIHVVLVHPEIHWNTGNAGSASRTFLDEAARLFWDAPLGAHDDVVLIFGRETGGLPSELHGRYRDRLVAMPILSPRVRSLNLSTSVALAAYDVLRQRRDRARSTH